MTNLIPQHDPRKCTTGCAASVRRRANSYSPTRAFLFPNKSFPCVLSCFLFPNTSRLIPQQEPRRVYTGLLVMCTHGAVLWQKSYSPTRPILFPNKTLKSARRRPQTSPRRPQAGPNQPKTTPVARFLNVAGLVVRASEGVDRQLFDLFSFHPAWS